MAYTCLPEYSEDNVIFSLRYLHKNDKINKRELVRNLEGLYKKLDHISLNFSWVGWINQLTFDDSGEMSDQIGNVLDQALEEFSIWPVDTNENDFGRKFHFRISKKFRAFGFQYKNLCMITHIDPNHERQKSNS